MAAYIEPPPPQRSIENVVVGGGGGYCYLQHFKLYETKSNFYMIGRDANKTFWRLLKINRLEPTELDMSEDATVYSNQECHDLLKRIHEGNKPTGGLRFVTYCYGIVGFIKFLGPYYMLLITRRRQIGTILGHTVYAITRSKMIAIPSPTVQSDITNSKNESRYKKLLSTVDLRKDFFFSYSYHVMRSLQKNLYDKQNDHVVYDTMFVWNEFLTRGIRNSLKSTRWTVALVYGFFKQDKLSIFGNEFKLTLIARRSRHYAGTRYLKRGVNEKGRVANDVETEQIVFQDVPGQFPAHVTSVVQNRGSIPLYWSQETSRINLKPDIILEKKDQNYEATRLHFKNLAGRYGNPIIILNLIKTQERKPRESKLRAEFVNAIHSINKDSSHENRLRFVHWDLSRRPRRKATEVLEILGKVAQYAIDLTGFLYCRVVPDLRTDDILTLHDLGVSAAEVLCKHQVNRNEEVTCVSRRESPEENKTLNDCLLTPPTFQKGVLRTNCIDCLDRTNVAQYAYGLAALGHQLYALGLVDDPKMDLNTTLADDLMNFYETMGDTLAVQYTGSAAHNKIFSERRGHWKAAIQSQEFLRTLQRYYSNAYMDAQKQDAINIFLGYFQPEVDKPALWVPDYCGRWANMFAEAHTRSLFRRSFSDGSIFSESSSAISATIGEQKLIKPALPGRMLGDGESKCLSESTPEISPCEPDEPSSRSIFLNNDQIGHIFHGSDFSNFLDLDQLSSSGNSLEEETYERSSLVNSPIECNSTECLIDETAEEITSSSMCEPSTKVTSSTEIQRADDISQFSNHFLNWVLHGETLCH